MTSTAPIAELLDLTFRECRALRAKLPGTFRIVVLGDSNAYGFALPPEDALPAQLQLALDDGCHPPIEVLNLAGNGTNFEALAVLADRFGGAIESDLVVVVPSAYSAYPWPRREAAQRVSAWRDGWEKQWEPASLGLFASTLAEMAASHARRNVKLVIAYLQADVADWPDDPEAGEPGPLPLRSLRQRCIEAGVTFVDLATLFGPLGRDAACHSPVDFHPSALGHRLAARELARALTPYLPGRHPVTSAQRDALVGAQLEKLVVADVDAPPGTGYALAHARSCRASFDATARAHAAALHEALSLVHFVHAGVADAYELNTVFDAVAQATTGLGLRLRLAAAGVEGARGDHALTDATAPVVATIREMQRLVDGVREMLTRPRATPLTASSATVAALETATRHAREHLASEAPRVLLPLARLASCCERFEELARVHAAARVDEDALVQWRALHERLQIMKRWLGGLAALRASRGRACNVLMDISLPEAAGTRSVASVTYTTIRPDVRELGFAMYVLRDGKTGRYAYRVPPGTTGRLSVQLFHPRPYARADVEERPADFMKLFVQRGESVVPFEIGDVVSAPHLDPCADDV